MSHSAAGTQQSEIECCNDCSQDDETSRWQQRERRRRRRRGRSAEVDASNCVECQSARSSRSNRRRSRSASAFEGSSVTSLPDPSDQRSSGSSQGSSSRSRRRRSGTRRRTSSRMINEHEAEQQLSEANRATSLPLSSSSDDLSQILPEDEAKRCQIRQWPHNLSFLFACLTCTVSMFSISRFAVLTIDYGAIFLVQFLLLTLIFGIPLLTFFASAGQYLGSGVIDMWRISPIFQGIGVSLMLSQGLYGLYNIAGISWLFVFFRDSFITSSDRYRWSLCFDGIKYMRACESVYNSSNGSTGTFSTWNLEETIPDYFNGIVLMRSAPTYPHSFTALRFQTLFNIVVTWMAVFIALSKGLKSYGRVVYLFGSFPFLAFLIFSSKVIGLLPAVTFKYWILNTQWLEFVYNGQSWICAARECFFIWGILGASILQLSSHNQFKHRLIRDTTIVIFVTLVTLVLAGITGVAMVLVIRSSGYDYTASSFETSASYKFLEKRTLTSRLMRTGRDYSPQNSIQSSKTEKETAASIDPFQIDDILSTISSDLEPKPSTQSPTRLTSKPLGYKRDRLTHQPLQPKRYSGRVVSHFSSPRHDREHISFLAGIRVLQQGRNTDKYSGYQVMRLATELMPAYAAILGPKILSPFWVVLFFLTMIVLGLAQQMALFHTVASGLIAIRPDHFMQFESSLTFMTCLLGLVLCFPLATEFGEFIVYFFDYTIGCGWWLMLLYALLIFAMFVIRGKPYNGENVARVLLKPELIENELQDFGKKIFCCCATWTLPVLAFSWTVFLPIGMVILAMVSFKTCYFAEMFDWTTHTGYLYLPSWVREIGAMLQLLPILIVPFVAIIQTCRYFLGGPEDLHEKINLLYRPSYANQIQQRTSIPGRTGRSGRSRSGGRHSRNNNGVILTNYNMRNNRVNNDPPPKYTPPPSYSTATGARIARFLRQSFRQSVRRFRGETSRQNSTELGIVNEAFDLPNMKVQNDDLPPPPDYATVVIETSRHTNLPGAGSLASLATSTDIVSSSASELNMIESEMRKSERRRLPPDLLLKAAAESLLSRETQDGDESHATSPWDFRFIPSASSLSSSSHPGGTLNSTSDLPRFEDLPSLNTTLKSDEYISVAEVTLCDERVESEKAKSSQTKVLNLDNEIGESSTDPADDASVIGYGESVILPGGRNNLESGLTTELNKNNLDLSQNYLDYSKTILEPRQLHLNIPPQTANEMIILRIDTSTSEL